MKLKTVLRGLQAWSGARPAPLSVSFEVTHLCNLACVYCDRHTPTPNEMTREQALAALTELCDLGLAHISFDGGEPLAHRHIDEFVDVVIGRGISVYMNTNGILIPRKLDVVRRVRKVKISMDGPAPTHDLMRGKAAFDRAVRGADAARDAGVAVELTCVVGSHNVHAVEAILDTAERLGYPIVFQPARPSLFLDTGRDGTAFVADRDAIRAAFARIAARKRSSPHVANGWASLRHFAQFPDDVGLPCAAGWINCTMDPDGNLYHCGQVNRGDTSHNVVRLGVKAAFEGLERKGCGQCWCARVVEENVAWGLRVNRMLPIARS